jgi:hypothetical protein
MSRRWSVAIVVVALAFGVGTAAGCKKGTPTTCKGWAKLLKSPVKGRDAIKSLGDLRCKESLKDLEGIFPTSQYKDEILQSVKAINAPTESAELIKKALQDPLAATLAASVAEDFANPDFRAPLIEILTTDRSVKARENALKALSKIDKANLKQDEDLFIQILRNDPNVQGVRANELAAKLLGDLKSEKAVKDLIVALFMRTQRGEQLYTPIRKQLCRVGKPAVAPLVGVLTNDQNFSVIIKDLQDSGKKMGLFDWQWQEGPELIQVLGDLRDTSAAKAVADSLAKPLNPPVGVDERVLRMWQVSQQNRITMAMMSLWNIGTPEVVATLKGVVTNADNDAKQRLDTASTLALMANFAGVSALVDIYAKEKDERFRAPLVKPLALGLDWSNRDVALKLLQADKSQLVKERITKNEAKPDETSPDALDFATMMSVLVECKQGDLDCLIAKLKGTDMIAAQKATILIGGSKGIDTKKAVTALIDRYQSTDPVSGVDLRRFILLAVWRLGDASAVPEVEKALQSDKDRKGAGYWIDELETLIPVLAAK